MKSLDEMNRLTAEDLERISLDTSIPVPEELSARVQEAISGAKASPVRWMIPAGAAAAVIAVIVTLGLTREPAPKDTFDDPYLAYAEVEKVFEKISGTMAYGANKVSETEAALDKLNYWK